MQTAYQRLLAARPQDVWLRHDVNPARIEDVRVAGSAVAWTSHHPIRAVRWLTVVGDDPGEVAALAAAALRDVAASGRTVQGVTVPEAAAALLAEPDRPSDPDRWTWWWTDAAPPVRSGESAVAALDGHDRRIAALLEHSGSAYVFPGDEHVRRWVGVSDGPRLVAVAAHVEHVPAVPHLASVCTDPDYRGRGLARDVCAVLTRDALAAGAPVVTLGMYADNTSAAAVYLDLGFRLDKRFSSGWLPGQAPPPGVSAHDVAAADGGGTAL